MPGYIYIWEMHFLSFGLAIFLYILNGKYEKIRKFLNFDNRILKNYLIFLLLLSLPLCLISILYYGVAKLLFGWHTDSWYIEGVFILLTFVISDIVFVAFNLKKHLQLTHLSKFIVTYKNLRIIYISVRCLFLLLIPIRIILAKLSLIFYSEAGDLLMPDLRYNDLHLVKNYYLDQNSTKKIFITRKIYFFEKDFHGSFYLDDRISNDDLKTLKENDYNHFYDEQIIKIKDTIYITDLDYANDYRYDCNQCLNKGCEICIKFKNSFRFDCIQVYKRNDTLEVNQWSPKNYAKRIYQEQTGKYIYREVYDKYIQFSIKVNVENNKSLYSIYK